MQYVGHFASSNGVALETDNMSEATCIQWCMSAGDLCSAVTFRQSDLHCLVHTDLDPKGQPSDCCVQFKKKTLPCPQLSEDGITRLRSLEEGHDRLRSLEEGHDRQRSLEEGHDRQRSLEEGHDRQRSLEEGHDRQRSLEEGHDRQRSLEEGHDRQKSFEEGHDSLYSDDLEYQQEQGVNVKDVVNKVMEENEVKSRSLEEEDWFSKRTLDKGSMAKMTSLEGEGGVSWQRLLMEDGQKSRRSLEEGQDMNMSPEEGQKKTGSLNEGGNSQSSMEGEVRDTSVQRRGEEKQNLLEAINEFRQISPEKMKDKEHTSAEVEKRKKNLQGQNEQQILKVPNTQGSSKEDTTRQSLEEGHDRQRSLEGHDAQRSFEEGHDRGRSLEEGHNIQRSLERGQDNQRTLEEDQDMQRSLGGQDIQQLLESQDRHRSLEGQDRHRSTDEGHDRQLPLEEGPDIQRSIEGQDGQSSLEEGQDRQNGGEKGSNLKKRFQTVQVNKISPNKETDNTLRSLPPERQYSNEDQNSRSSELPQDHEQPSSSHLQTGLVSQESSGISPGHASSESNPTEFSPGGGFDLPVRNTDGKPSGEFDLVVHSTDGKQGDNPVPEDQYMFEDILSNTLNVTGNQDTKDTQYGGDINSISDMGSIDEETGEKTDIPSLDMTSKDLKDIIPFSNPLPDVIKNQVTLNPSITSRTPNPEVPILVRTDTNDLSLAGSTPASEMTSEVTSEMTSHGEMTSHTPLVSGTTTEILMDFPTTSQGRRTIMATSGTVMTSQMTPTETSEVTSNVTSGVASEVTSKATSVTDMTSSTTPDVRSTSKSMFTFGICLEYDLN